MVLSKFTPGTPRFSARFAEAARNAHAAALALVDLLENYSDVEARVQRVRALEHVGDRLSREVANLLAESFTVPLDREDVISLDDERTIWWMTWRIRRSSSACTGSKSR